MRMMGGREGDWTSSDLGTIIIDSFFYFFNLDAILKKSKLYSYYQTLAIFPIPFYFRSVYLDFARYSIFSMETHIYKFSFNGFSRFSWSPWMKDLKILIEYLTQSVLYDF